MGIVTAIARLAAAPVAVPDLTGTPAFGTYQGAFAVVDLRPLADPHGRGPLGRLLHHKKWVYTFASNAEVSVLCAVVDTTYATTAFVTVTDMRTGDVVTDRSVMAAPGPRPAVGDHPAHGLRASTWSPLGSFRIDRPAGSADYRLTVAADAPAEAVTSAVTSLPDLIGAAARAIPVVGDRFGHGGAAGDVGVPAKGRVRIDLAFDAGRTPELSVVAPVESGGGSVNVTQKVAGLPVRGTIVAGGRTWTVDDAVGGLDYTHGYLARSTAWNWAFLVGRLDDGRRIGLNLVAGFNEARDDVNENALWLDDRLVPLDRARFDWDRTDPLSTWSVRTVDGAVELEFTPYAVHSERKDLVVITSRFLQPIGVFSGTVRVDGVEHRVRGIPGVVEDQDVRW